MREELVRAPRLGDRRAVRGPDGRHQPDPGPELDRAGHPPRPRAGAAGAACCSRACCFIVPAAVMVDRAGLGLRRVRRHARRSTTCCAAWCRWSSRSSSGRWCRWPRTVREVVVARGAGRGRRWRRTSLGVNELVGAVRRGAGRRCWCTAAGRLAAVGRGRRSCCRWRCRSSTDPTCRASWPPLFLDHAQDRRRCSTARGYVLLAFLEADFVDRLGWITRAQQLLRRDRRSAR